MEQRVTVHGSIEIQIHSRRICIVTLRGEHDAASSEAVTLALAAARGYDNVLVDLAPCTFIDSTLITALLVGARRARRLGGALELVLPRERGAVRRTLEIANVQMLLPFHASRREAVAALDARGRMRRPEMRVVGARPGVAGTHAGTTILRARVVADGAGLEDAGAIARGRGEQAA
jgi:anti-anti-sigma factor